MGIPAPLGVAAAGVPPLNDQANAVVQGTLAAIGPGLPFAIRGPMNIAVWAAAATTLTTTAGSTAASVASATGIAAGVAVNSANVPRGTTIASISGTDVVLALPPVTLPASNLSTAGPQITLPPGSNVSTLLGATVTVPSNAEGVTIPANTTVNLIVQTDIAPSLNDPGRPGIVQLSAAPTAVPAISTIIKPQPLQFAVTGNAITAGSADAAALFTGAAISYSATIQIERSFDGGSTWLLCNIGGAGALAKYTTGLPLSLTFGEPERNVLYRVNCVAYTSGTIRYRMSATGEAATSLSIPSVI